MPQWIYFNPKSVGKSWDSEKIKIVVPFRPYRHIIENSKKIAKQFKKLKNTFTASFETNIYVGKGWESEKIKNIVSFRPYPTRNRKLQKNSNKIEKN